jgi:Quercetinase C-terminal cupin domain
LLEEGDGAAINEESDLGFEGKGADTAEFLLFDLA